MSALELIAVLFSLASVVLAVRRHPATWPAGIIAVAAYFAIFVRTRLYADAALQIVFLLQGVYGWAFWMRSRRAGSGAEGRVTSLGWPARVSVAAIATVAAWAVGGALARYTDASSPHLDATVSVLSLTANWLLARRVIDNWAFWITADVLYIGLFASKGLMASAVLYVLFLVLAIGGWRSWARQAVADTPAEAAPGNIPPTPARGIA
jgi:nicotinamide mononucleotide transporter